MPDARTRHYRDAHQLALMVLTASGIHVGQGPMSMWTFLYRTPEPVEDGVRASLRRHLTPTWEVAKKGMRLAGSKHRLLQPDLVFGDHIAVGDVKYKTTTDGEISRSNLNQITTFATGYGSTKAVVVAFGDVPVGEYVQVGDVHVSGINWNTSAADPRQAGAELAVRISSWLS
jgi:5-methylcytosine-specific restriction endonuclease McrBC regulatory subunit McrC